MADKLMLEISTHRGCTLSYYGTFRKNRYSSVQYAKCMYKSHHQSFKFVFLHPEEGFIKAFIYGTKCDDFEHTGANIFKSLRGNERKEVGESLKNSNPRTIHIEEIRRVDQELYSEGNAQNLRKLHVYQKIKSEKICENDTKGLESFHLQDLFQKFFNDRKLSDPYIQKASLPLTIHLYSKSQFSILS